MEGFDNYRCDGQMSLFAFIEDNSWNPVEAYAHRGSGFSGGKERIKDYSIMLNNKICPGCGNQLILNKRNKCSNCKYKIKKDFK